MFSRSIALSLAAMGVLSASGSRSFGLASPMDLMGYQLMRSGGAPERRKRINNRSKYAPHQGERECARRVRQAAGGRT